jgi:Putative prokaryotic signal transducing protein
MADRLQPPAGPGTPHHFEHELGTSGDQDIVKGPRATDEAVFVRIGTAEDPLEADLLTTALDEAGIPVVARAQKDHLLDPLVNPNVPFWAIMVPSEFAGRAQAIVDERIRELRAEEPALAQAADEEELATEYVPPV